MARETPVRITTARVSAAADQRTRVRRYVWSMAFRTLCFVAAVVVGPGWLRWVLVVGAVFLPYVAVVMANATDQRGEGHALQSHLGDHQELHRQQEDDPDA